ncbi:hypothetical protein BCR36DRAFT_410904 [Piromyces finnis]|uniref:Microtubule-associated protein Jupiter n=1 Tax=Piromyces finnis TaxID=1754191 RepID=A0A1Y1VEH8_9FUNG|nr:hypothetical protein BCR36DRAFT_410904 [Piromyces finnis]|eukprot:ORX53720.1 hypothetical protein BCR36DRAFT_410904 [Piromyces finnis]
METFNYKDDRYSIRPQAPPGGETHFNISDSGYGNKNIYHPHKRFNHPNNDINPPPNHVKKEETIENTANGAAPVTGNRPSIKLRAPPGGFSSLDYYSENTTNANAATNTTKTETTIIQNSVVCDEPQTEQKLINKSENNASKPTQNSTSSNSSSLFNDNNATYRPVYTPQAPPGGKSSISLGYDNDETVQMKPKPKPNPEYKSSMFSSSTETTPISSRRNQQTKQNNQTTFSSSIFGTAADDNQPYKPYYAPQAPPGGKDSISLGNVDNQQQTKQNNQTTFSSSIFGTATDNNQPYKPYYAPQAPPGGKDSISLGGYEKDNTTTTQTSFSGRRRNYNNDHFKSSFGFNY